MTVDKTFCTIGLGELLWDLLPAGKQLGGAPANFGYMANLLGDEGVIASRVGDDALGREAMATLSARGLGVSAIQIDATNPTGTVLVSVEPDGQPDYEIKKNTAWDFLELTSDWQEWARKADVVCFGSLAQRNPASRRTIQSFLRAMRKEATRIFDINLRQSFYSADLLTESLRLADLVKVNEDEFPVLCNLLAVKGPDAKQAALEILQAYDLHLVCITRGAQGSLLVGERATSDHPGIPTTVKDTVGAGDAFTAALAYHYVRGTNLDELNHAANLLGSWVAGETGAMPPCDEAVLARVRRKAT